MAASDKTAIQCVMEADEERNRLEREAEDLAHRTDAGIKLIYFLFCAYIFSHFIGNEAPCLRKLLKNDVEASSSSSSQ